MRPPCSFIGQPIRSLQTMLQIISEVDSNYPRLIPDGVYGPDTSGAVSFFQREHALPATGVTDQQTWDMIVDTYEKILPEVDAAVPVEIEWNSAEVITKGTKHPYMSLAQCMLNEIGRQYGCYGEVEICGALDDATADALSCFQDLCGLPANGNLDKTTWKNLTLHYPLALSSGSRKNDF